MLLTVNNLRTSNISFQTDGLAFLSFTVPGSGAVTNKVVTQSQFALLEAQLAAATAAGHVTWSLKDDASSASDGVPFAPGQIVVEQDFLFTAGAALPLPLAKAVQGSATGDFVANALGGVYSLATAAVSEAEAAQLTFGDQLVFDPTKGLIFEARVRLDIPGATISADERWVVGVCSAHATAQTSLDNTTINAWFRGEGANLNIYVETDDNVTDSARTQTDSVYADNTFMMLKIDMTDLTKVKFSINDKPFATTFNMSALTSSTPVQPIFCYQRDAANEINLLQVDWFRVSATR